MFEIFTQQASVLFGRVSFQPDLAVFDLQLLRQLPDVEEQIFPRGGDECLRQPQGLPFPYFQVGQLFITEYPEAGCREFPGT